MVAVAGPPGSGKTAFAMILVAVINAETDGDVAVMVGLDGWHYPNDYLATHFIERDGERVTLQRIKGAPETFNVTAAYECLSRICRGDEVSFPIYSRALHEPIPAEGKIKSSHRIVVVEGNYLLLDEEAWARFCPLFDIRIFVSVSLETLVAGLRERHVSGGKTVATTERQIRDVDLPNAERVGPSIVYANVIVHKADTRRIGRIESRLQVPYRTP
jgi:pantothenate kinase